MRTTGRGVVVESYAVHVFPLRHRMRPAASDRTTAQIQAQVELHPEDGPVAEYLLHIEDDHAWFRWSDTPFD